MWKNCIVSLHLPGSALALRYLKRRAGWAVVHTVPRVLYADRCVARVAEALRLESIYILKSNTDYVDDQAERV